MRNGPIITILAAVILFSTANTAYYAYNVHLIVEAMDFLAAIPPQKPSPEEIAAAKVVLGNGDGTISMTLPWEQERWLGRELAILVVLGSALYVVVLLRRRRTL